MEVVRTRKHIKEPYLSCDRPHHGCEKDKEHPLLKKLKLLHAEVGAAKLASFLHTSQNILQHSRVTRLNEREGDSLFGW